MSWDLEGGSPVEITLSPDTALDALSAVEVEQSLYGAIPSAGMFRPQKQDV